MAASLEKYVPYVAPIATVGLIGLVAAKFGFFDFRSGKEKAKEKDKDVEAIKVNESRLNRERAAYKSIAENLYREINSLFLTKDKKVIEILEPKGGLNGDELRQIYKDFGLRCDSYSPKGIPGDWTFCVGDKHDLFWWFEKTTSGNALKRIKQIFDRAKLGW